MSSKRRIRRKQCGHKVKFVSLADAHRRAVELWGKGIRLRAYRCRWCNQFHIGHIPRAVIRAIRTRKELD